MNIEEDHQTLESLKASIVTGFADMPRYETTLLLIIPAMIIAVPIFSLRNSGEKNAIKLLTLSRPGP